MWFCENCGKKITGIANFCQYCGSPKHQAMKEETEIPQVSVEEIVTEQLQQSKRANFVEQEVIEEVTTVPKKREIKLICPSCGTEMKSGLRFCKQCGQKLTV